MAIPTTYAELLTEVADWTKRSDMTARIPVFVAMGESAMNAKLRLRAMEDTAALSLAGGADYVALPARFLEPISLVWADSSEPLLQADRGSIDAAYGTTGRPTHYAIGSRIDFNSTADGAYALTLRYFKRLDLATDLTNEILTTAPFAYLYGALQAYARWIEDDAQLATYGALFNAEVQNLRMLDDRSRPVAALRTDVPNFHEPFDITTG